MINKEEKYKGFFVKNLFTFKYSLVQGSYWAAFCAIIGYASPFLISRDFNGRDIGILIACGNILSVILQPMIAALADRSKRLKLNVLSAIIAMGAFFALLLLLLIPGSFYISAGLFTLVLTVTGVLMPMINSLSVNLMNKGYHVNYGVARGIGSLCYAAISYFLGYLINIYGENIILATALILYLVVVLSLLFFKSVHKNVLSEYSYGEEHTVNPQDGSLLVFIKSYKRFLLMNLGIICLFTFHNIINTYLIQIMLHVGGNSSDMGVSIAIAALLELPAMFLFSYMVRRIPANKLLKISASFFAIKSVAFYYSSSVLMIHLSQGFQLLSFALYIPASVHYASELMKEGDKVKGQAIISASLTAGGVVGSLLGGYLLEAKGVSAMLLAGAIFSVIGMLIFFLSTPAPQEGT